MCPVIAIDGEHAQILHMRRPYRRAKTAGNRICQRCETEKPATPEHFVTDASRALGVGYECRSCHAARKVSRDRSAERPSALTGARREKHIDRQRRYIATHRGRCAVLRARYKQIDACDLTLDELAALLSEPCVYCGTVESPRGLDRLDNAGAHTRGNVQPSCNSCNATRGNRLTVDEAKALIRDRLGSRNAVRP